MQDSSTSTVIDEECSVGLIFNCLLFSSMSSVRFSGVNLLASVIQATHGEIEFSFMLKRTQLYLFELKIYEILISRFNLIMCMWITINSCVIVGFQNVF